MSHLKFVHASDLHLDSPLRCAFAPPSAERALKEATFRAFANVVDLCLREKVDFLLLAGDLFDAKERSLKARLFLREQLHRLHEAKIPSFLVHGNHDPLSGDEGRVALPSSAKIFGAEWEEVPLFRGDELLCRIQGISYPDERMAENLTRRFRRQGPELAIGLLHANLGGCEAHENYSPCTMADLADAGLDYWALGHVHTRAEHDIEGGGVAVYPGNPQGRHIRETGERGCMLVEVTGRKCVRTFVPVDAVRWHSECISIEGLSQLDELIVRADEHIRQTCADASRLHLLRLTLEGRGALHREVQSGPGRMALEECLQNAWAPDGILLQALETACAPALDFSAFSSGGGLLAEVVEVASRTREEAALMQELWRNVELDRLESALARLGLRFEEGGRQRLLRRAVGRSLSLLSEDGR
jgi:DNA repair exonuclease SbcCD nuclease subunit